MEASAAAGHTPPTPAGHTPPTPARVWHPAVATPPDPGPTAWTGCSKEGCRNGESAALEWIPDPADADGAAVWLLRCAALSRVPGTAGKALLLILVRESKACTCAADCCS
jgi:hypothetical protein